MNVWAVKAPHNLEEPSMQTITTIGLDIAKSVFQVHGVDAEGKVIIRRQLKRRYVLAFFRKQAPCLVGIEACASSHAPPPARECHECEYGRGPGSDCDGR